MNPLAHLTPDDVIRHPYAHILCEHVLPDDLCRELARTYPATESFTRGATFTQSTKFFRRAPELLADPSLAPVWRDLIHDLTRPRLLDDAFRLFGDDIFRAYPNFDTLVGPRDALRVGIRGVDDAESHHVLLDLICVIFTAPRGRPSLHRMPHIKNPDKFWESTLFLPVEGDRGTGGDVEIYELKDPASATFTDFNQTDFSAVRLVRSAPYRRGVFMSWVNSPTSVLHYALRTGSTHPQRLLEIVATVPRPLFEVPRKPGWRPVEVIADSQRNATPQPVSRSIFRRLRQAVFR